MLVRPYIFPLVTMLFMSVHYFLIVFFGGGHLYSCIYIFQDTRYTDGAIGQLGVSANLLSMAGSFLIPPVVQVLGLQRRWKWVIIVLLFVAAAGVAGFTYLLYDVYEPPPSTNHTNQTNRSQMYSIYSAYPTDGNAAVPPYSLQYAQYMHAHSYYPNDVFGPVGGGGDTRHTYTFTSGEQHNQWPAADWTSVRRR